MIKLKRNLRLLLALNLFQFKEDYTIFPVNKNTSQQNEISKASLMSANKKPNIG